MTTIDELSALVESNARSIQALSQEWRAAAEVNRVDMAAVNQRMTNIEATLERTERIQENNSVQLAELTTSVAETNQRIQVLIEESRDTRNWLRAAQENIQTLFSEIREIWNRINAA
ncbi:hypothetical protein N836_13640 [Leptolyngbya sp. Heron Island J]|uniref:hypothetical protein n=1 Tax=Leptolyngbya sp. Heron Island J TaxID=1385935 RepID=UPI0003B99264|nr:hypothetical protein [Leptolyngbya sp. Heron Island J]ESA35103.1 hypothetical protein N836_13640 [Leptolyngbya sp. Heron Island J]